MKKTSYKFRNIKQIFRPIAKKSKKKRNMKKNKNKKMKRRTLNKKWS